MCSFLYFHSMYSLSSCHFPICMHLFHPSSHIIFPYSLRDTGLSPTFIFFHQLFSEWLWHRHRWTTFLCLVLCLSLPQMTTWSPHSLYLCWLSLLVVPHFKNLLLSSHSFMTFYLQWSYSLNSHETSIILLLYKLSTLYLKLSLKFNSSFISSIH